MAKFRVMKAVVVEAVQWDGESGTANEFLGEDYGTDWRYTWTGPAITIRVLGDEVRVEVGDWIIKRENGDLSVCTPGLFEQTHEAME